MTISSKSKSTSELRSGGGTSVKDVNLLAYILNVAVTYGIGAAGLFGFPTNSEVSAKYQTVITPAGWAFAIWGIIFMAQAAWVVQQLLSDRRRNLNPYKAVEEHVSARAVAAVGNRYLYAVLAQAAWTLAFSHEKIALSNVFMVLILWQLFVIVRSLTKLDRGSEPRSTIDACTSYLLLEFPFSIHFGWILAATVVNANMTLVSTGCSSLVQFCGAIGGLTFLVSAAVLLITKSHLTAPIAVAWALIGGFVVYGALKATMGLRLSEEEEFAGADLSIHKIGSTPERETNW